MTFMEQLKENKNPAINKIAKYLLSRDDLKNKIENENKTLKGMFDYIVSEAKKSTKNNCVCVEDEIVFGWAVHYYDEENIKTNNVTSTVAKKPQKKDKNLIEGQMSLF